MNGTISVGTNGQKNVNPDMLLGDSNYHADEPHSCLETGGNGQDATAIAARGFRDWLDLEEE